MIPFIIARDNDVINLTQVVRLQDLETGEVVVTLSTGDEIRFSPDEAKESELVKQEIAFNLRLWRDYRRQLQTGIVTANGKAH